MAYTTIKKPSDYFNTKLYTGNGSTQSITGVNFTPDFTWIKQRDELRGHGLFDVVRGVTKLLDTKDTAAEATVANTLTSFDSDGFSLGSYDTVNKNTQSYASWNWLASNTTASNTDGEQSATVSANTTSGFSIIKWTGNASGAKSTVGHGLGVTPNVFITKKTNDTSSWIVYHSAMDTTGDYYLNLENNIAKTNYNEVFGDGMTSSVCGLAGFHTTGTYVGYAFAEKKGFSKFGSYTGNGNADGTFIYTGFKPAFIIVKKTNSTFNWIMYDNKRDELNPNTATLLPDDSGSEYNIGRDIDFLSNGFKMRANYSGNNNSGDSYIYMAFAEEPLVGDNPATAR